METLLKLRHGLGLTQQEMASRMGVPRMKYAKVELGYQPPDVWFISAAGRAFGLKPEDLYRIFLLPYLPVLDSSKRTKAPR